MVEKTRHIEDARSKKVVFVSNCLLNSNNKVKEFARYPGICKEVVDVLYENDLGIIQMPCLESLYMGMDRYWYVKKLYDNVGFRRFCREKAEEMCDYMENYEKAGFETVCILGSNGSPTCGVTMTCYSKDWGGQPKKVDNDAALVEGPGVYFEELVAAIEDRKLKSPPMYGLMLDQKGKPYEEIIEEFNSFIKGLLK